MDTGALSPGTVVNVNPIGTYYFDASISGPTDPNGVWYQSINAFDGNTSTFAFCSGEGTSSSNYLQGVGTNAPTSGDVISQIRARTSGNSYTDYIILDVPSGGWTWSKVKNLACRIWVNPANEGNSPTHTAIYTSDDIGGTALGTVDGAITPNGLTIIEIEVTSGVGTVAWSNPDNAKVSDNVYATNSGNTEWSHYLKANNFGFSIPTGATINGILVEFERKSSDANTISGLGETVKIIKADGSIGTTNKGVATYWSTSESYISYGSSTDLWGETWTPVNINDVDFGVVLSAVMENYATASIDHIRITVYYTEANIVSPFPSFFRTP